MFHILRDLLRYNREFAIGVAFLGLIVVYSLLSFVSPVVPELQFVEFPDLPPSGEYWFGTNSRGQDLFWQLTFAFRNTLGFGIMVAAFSRVISITVGLVSGYVGGVVDRVLMVVNDVFVTLPLLPVLLVFYFVLGNSLNTINLALLMACLGWPFDARLIRSIALGLRHREFTRHATFSGMSPLKIMFEEHLPRDRPVRGQRGGVEPPALEARVVHHAGLDERAESGAAHPPELRGLRLRAHGAVETALLGGGGGAPGTAAPDAGRAARLPARAVQRHAAARHHCAGHLVASLPHIGDSARKPALGGRPPNLSDPPGGCRFHPRCPLAIDKCRTEVPPLETVGADHRSACWRSAEVEPLTPASRRAKGAAA